MKIDGGCHCGNITYVAEIDPDKVGLCHCTDCQTLSGSAFRISVPAARNAFSLSGGQPKIYVKTAESGAKRAQAFCPECGTPIYAAAQPTLKYSISAWALCASEPSYGREHKGGADPRATGLWICIL